MIEKDDWRLNGQEDYLMGKTIYRRKWKSLTNGTDHYHCEFCWARFSDFHDDLHEGYSTEDNHYWICLECHNDFKDMFKWNSK